MVWWADRHWLLPKAVKHRRDIYCFRQKPGRREKKIAAGRVVLFFLFGRPPLNPTGRHRRSGHLWPLALILWSAPASGYRGKRHYNGRSVTFCNPTHHPTSVPVALAARATAPERNGALKCAGFSFAPDSGLAVRRDAAADKGRQPLGHCANTLDNGPSLIYTLFPFRAKEQSSPTQ